MTITLAVIGVTLALVWVLIIHPLLHKWRITHNLFELLDARDVGLGSRLRVALSGLKRQMFARLVWIFGLMTTIHELLLPHLTTIQPLIPSAYQAYLLPAMTIIGVLFEVLSKMSVQPVGEINPEVLATSTNQPLGMIAKVTRDDPAVGQVTKTEANQ